jgi:prepilin-type N-terminal cleavage/methylation domain-containing protein
MLGTRDIKTFSRAKQGCLVMKVRNSQKGFLLIEILVGLALMGIIATGFINGLSTTFTGVTVSQERVTAESLAKSQIEYIKVQDYIPIAEYVPVTNCYELIDIPADLVAAGYTVEITSLERHIISDVIELQSVTVVVKRNARGKLIISVYRVGD